MLYPKKLSWILALLLCCRVALAGNLQISPEAPVAGDRILLSLDEYLPDEAKVTWKYQQADESQWHEIVVSDGYPEFVAKGAGNLIVRCEITAADDTKKAVAPDRFGKLNIGAFPCSSSHHELSVSGCSPSNRRSMKRLESKYDVAQKTSAAIHESRIYQDDQQFLEHAQQVAEIYLRGADNFLKIGEHANLRNRAEATQQLVNELAKIQRDIGLRFLSRECMVQIFHDDNRHLRRSLPGTCRRVLRKFCACCVLQRCRPWDQRRTTGRSNVRRQL